MGLSTLARVFLFLHVTVAVLVVGTGYVYPILMKQMKQKGPGRPPIIRTMSVMEKAFTVPFVFIQPITGLGLILTTHDRWNPFHAANRWLFAALILFVALMVLELFVSAPAVKGMAELAAAGKYDDEAFDKILGRLEKIGPAFGILFIIITVLMVLKPGANVPHF
ncbi:MAG: DUF2269 family protein [Actinomycetota bacterium]|nr:DUF2269 domain-containing protein [Actinomycetota bacterium]